MFCNERIMSYYSNSLNFEYCDTPRNRAYGRIYANLSKIGEIDLATNLIPIGHIAPSMHRRRYEFNKYRTDNYSRRALRMRNIQNFRTGKSLFIYNISRTVNIKNLASMFRRVGPVAFFSVHLDQNGKIVGTGEIRYEERSSACNALARFQGKVIEGRKLDIRALGSSLDYR